MMKRIYMDIPEETHAKFKALAKGDRRTMKGFLEYLVNDFVSNPKGKGVKKRHGKK